MVQRVRTFERVQELHGVDLVREFRHRKRRDLGFEGFEPWRARWQVHPLALDLGRLRDRAFDLAQFGVVGVQPTPRYAPGCLTRALPIAIPTPEVSSTTELALYFSFIWRIAGSIL